jgi:hypothetical protein
MWLANQVSLLTGWRFHVQVSIITPSIRASSYDGNFVRVHPSLHFESTPLHTRYSILIAQNSHASFSRLVRHYSLNHRRLIEETTSPLGALLAAPAERTQKGLQYRIVVPTLTHLQLEHGAVRHPFRARLCANRPTSIVH